MVPPPTEPTDEERAALFAERVMRPQRPLLARHLATLTGAPAGVCAEACARPDPLAWVAGRRAAAGERWVGHTDPQEAWEALCPEDWMGDDRRGFAAGPDGDARPWPPTLRAALAIASDPEGVLAAESLTREMIACIGPSGAANPASMPVTWTVGPPQRWRARCLRQGPPDGERMSFASARDGARPDAVEERARGFAAKVVSRCPTSLGGVVWDAARVAYLERVERGSALVSQATALFALWSLGYGLDRFDAERAILFAPMG